MMTLQDRCLGLPYLERLNLCSALQESILQERMERRHPKPSRCGVLTALMEEIGFTDEEFAVIHPGGAVGERLNANG